MNKEERYKWKLKRMGKNITLKEVGEYVGFTLSMISKYENNHKDMEDYRIARYKEYIENKEI